MTARSRLMEGNTVTHCDCSSREVDEAGVQVHYIDCSAFSAVPIDPRARLLANASDLVTGDRAAVYGEPAVNFDRIARLHNVYLDLIAEHRDDTVILPHDVAILHILGKVARLIQTPTHEDGWTDIAGYAATGFVTAKETP